METANLCHTVITLTMSKRPDLLKGSDPKTLWPHSPLHHPLQSYHIPSAFHLHHRPIYGTAQATGRLWLFLILAQPNGENRQVCKRG